MAFSVAITGGGAHPVQLAAMVVEVEHESTTTCEFWAAAVNNAGQNGTNLCDHCNER